MISHNSLSDLVRLAEVHLNEDSVHKDDGSLLFEAAFYDKPELDFYKGIHAPEQHKPYRVFIELGLAARDLLPEAIPAHLQSKKSSEEPSMKPAEFLYSVLFGQPLPPQSLKTVN